MTSGIRLGTPAVTTRGLKEGDMQTIADYINTILTQANDEAVIQKVKGQVNELMSARPLFQW